MTRSMRESDWKVFRQLHPIALEFFCQLVLAEIVEVTGDDSQTAPERYLAVYDLIQRRDRDVAIAFNDKRRSTALRQLAYIQRHELLTEEEMSRLSLETNEAVQRLLELSRG